MVGETTDALIPKQMVYHYCPCGGEIKSVDGLDGSFCVKCGKHYDEDAPREEETKAETPDIETIKAYRGTQCHEFVYGASSRGSIHIQIPFFFSENQAKAMIDQQIRLLVYLKERCKESGLDLEAHRK